MRTYRSLDAWKLAHGFAVVTLKTTNTAWHPQARHLFDQLRRAAISVPANIVEGYALGTSPQFARHLRIALGSAAEAEYLLELGSQCGYFPPGEGRELAQRAARLLAVLYGLLRTVRERR